MKIFEIMKWSVKYENNAVPVSRPFSGAAKLSQTTVCSDKIDRAGPRAVRRVRPHQVSFFLGSTLKASIHIPYRKSTPIK